MHHRARPRAERSARKPPVLLAGVGLIHACPSPARCGSDVGQAATSVRVSGCPASLGSRSAATRPSRANPTSTIIATTYDLVPSETAETRIVPAIAVPNDDPRLETLRERPEISPCISSEKLDWTTFTDGVSIAPTPSPNRNRPSRKATAR